MSRPGFPVTGGTELRLFGAKDDSMATERTRDHNDEDPLEQSELARRLRRMEWPPAPPAVKERVLNRIVAQSKRPSQGEDGDSSTSAGSN